MEKKIAAESQQRIEEEQALVESAVITYLTGKYADISRDAIAVEFSKPELNFFLFEAVEFKELDESYYTGYFICRVSVAGEEFEVRISPTETANVYEHAGADNRQTLQLQEDIGRALGDMLPFGASVLVQAGSLLPSAQPLLEGFYDGGDWFTPIPADGCLYVQVEAPEEYLKLDLIAELLDDFFGACDVQDTYLCGHVLRREGETGEAGQAPIVDAIEWEMGVWDNSALLRRLTGK